MSFVGRQFSSLAKDNYKGIRSQGGVEIVMDLIIYIHQPCLEKFHIKLLHDSPLEREVLGFLVLYPETRFFPYPNLKHGSRTTEPPTLSSLQRLF